MLNTLVLLTALAGAPAADSIPGSWQIRGDAEGNPLAELCTIKQEGVTLTGSCALNGSSYPLTGEVKDGTITFRHAAGEYEGTAIALAFSGALTSANEIKGRLTVDPFGVGGEFTAVRAPAQ